MMDRLPKDLWIQIFVQLPAKTILRCLSVCKSWKLSIQHQSFIDAHLQHQRQDLMLVRYIPEDDIKSDNNSAQKQKPEVYSLHIDDESFSVHAHHEFPVLNPTGEHYRAVGSCNGIICISNDGFCLYRDTYFWNPAIKKCIKLPCPNLINIIPFDHELGFGFEEKTNDYKVVGIVDPLEVDDSYESPLEVEIYSLSSGIWRMASHLASNLDIHLFSRDERKFQVYLNGAVHWVGRNRKRSSSMIIAFLLGEEVFRCFELPIHTECGYYFGLKLRLVVFEGALSVFHYKEEKFGIWVMKDYGASSSWSKHLDITLSARVQRVIGIRNKGELLIEISGGLYSYDPQAMKGKQFNFLDGRDLLLWKRLQEGQAHFFVREYVRGYDPEAAPKELGIRSETRFGYEFHCERHIESLVLLGSVNSAEICQVESEESESERILEEGNRVVDLTAELQHLGQEAEKSCNKMG